MRDIPARVCRAALRPPARRHVSQRRRAAGASRNSSLPTGSSTYSTSTAASMPGRSKSTGASHVTNDNTSPSTGSDDDDEHEKFVRPCSALRTLCAARPWPRKACWTSISERLVNDPSVREAEATYRASAEVKPQARSSLLPTLNFGSTLQHRFSESQTPAVEQATGVRTAARRPRKKSMPTT